MKAVILLLLAMYETLLGVQAEEVFPLAIIQAPTSQLVPADEQTVTFDCTVRGEDMDWWVNGDYSSHQRNQELINSKVQFHKGLRVNGVLSASITFPITEKFNSTQLRCIALNISTTLESSNAVLTIAGSPLPPHPQVEVMSTTELKVTWEEPFTFESFPILDYNITVYNSSTPNDSHTYTVTNRSKLIRINTETDTCSLLRFEVTARNVIDRSRVGTTSGGFPVVPDKFPSKPEAEVRFSSDATPELKISFTPPAVCSFQDAHYQVTVYRAGFSDPVYEGEPQPINNSDQVVEAEISSVFQANSPYYAIVTFVTHSKHVSANTSFSTAFHPTAPVTPEEEKSEDTKGTNLSGVQDSGDDSSNLPVLISAAVGGCVAVATLTIIIIIVIIILLRRQLSKKSNTEREKRNSMVDNPLYEGPIYEVVSENKRRKPLLPKTKVHVQESLYLDSPTQSLPHECVPSYNSNGLMVRVNITANSKQHAVQDTPTATLEGVTDGTESNLDHPKTGDTYENENAMPVTPTEDPYTIMCPVLPAGNMTCHTNYHVTSHMDTVCGRYVADVNNGSHQKQVTLV
jgi:hypothetical protein